MSAARTVRLNTPDAGAQTMPRRVFEGDAPPVLKILYHHRIGSKDGQYVHIEEMLGALRAAGHDVRVVGPSGFDTRSFGGESSLVARLKACLPRVVYEVLELAYNLVDYARLARVIKQFSPDVIYERYNLLLLSGAMARHRFGLPLLLEVNAPLLAERATYGGIRLRRLASWSERHTWRSADHVFAVTNVLAGRVSAAGVAESRITVTPNGINLTRFGPHGDVAAAKRRLGIDPSATVLGFVGFAREWHRLDAVVELLTEHGTDCNLHFLLVGDGPVIEALHHQAYAAGVVDRMTVTGVVARDAVRDWVDAFDVALLPNVVAYASPLKLFEYMACRKAIVAPDQPNLAEILTDGHDAILFEPSSIDAFKAAVRQFLGDAALRARLAAAAYDTLISHDYTWTANARHVASVAERHMARGTRRGVVA